MAVRKVKFFQIQSGVGAILLKQGTGASNSVDSERHKVDITHEPGVGVTVKYKSKDNKNIEQFVSDSSLVPGMEYYTDEELKKK